MAHFKYPDGVAPNLMAIGYAFAGTAIGFALITSTALALNLVGVLLLAHAMTIAAYLVHECAHNSLFATNADNARLGRVLLWLCGGCYATYEDIRHKHFRHHIDRADVVAFDYRPLLANHPRLLRVLEMLEWAWIPAFDLLMHLSILVLPFVWGPRKKRRMHVITTLVVRTALFTLLAAFSPRVLLLYPLAYLLMLHVLRFMDAFQHTYEVDTKLDTPRATKPRFDAAFEQRNTFTNLQSLQHPWLNLVTLNFGYHNAHHERPVQAWHRLPALHRELYGDPRSEKNRAQMIPFANQWHAYRLFRTQRLLNEDPADAGIEKIPYATRGREFVGVDGVSFLVTH